MSYLVPTLLLLACIASLSDVGATSPPLRAPARLAHEDCNCQCINLSFSSGGRTQGNCRSSFQGSDWCYVRDDCKSTCFDATPSERYPGRYWSYHACTTPAPESKECFNLIRSCPAGFPAASAPAVGQADPSAP